MSNISISERAVKEIIKLSKKSTEAGLRVGIRGGGCAGFEYICSIADSPAKDDKVVEQDGARIFIDPKSLIFLTDLNIDYRTALMGAGFQFANPNSTETCGCGTSFSV